MNPDNILVDTSPPIIIEAGIPFENQSSALKNEVDNILKEFSLPIVYHKSAYSGDFQSVEIFGEKESV